MAKDKIGEFSAKESESRLQAALRGARIAGHKQMSDVSPKRNIGKVATKPANAKRPR